MNKRYFEGNIVSTKMNKTVIVAVEMPKKHALYGKAIKMTKRFLVRNAMDAKLGDKVAIEECRPFSSKSTWQVITKLNTQESK